ncbi:MAG: NADH-quinone oxidoreductase subunit J [Candidatus Melainabacteria bacterium]|nr:NADH-quinone oxidoreductase subunit J [Candidatus Melainabacteria bacterium]
MNFFNQVSIDTLFFWFFAAVAVISSAAVVLNKSIVYSVLFLILSFLSVAAIFALNNADFLAIAQAIVYAVGLAIVLLFGVMFTGIKPLDVLTRTKRESFVFVSVILFSVTLLTYMLLHTPLSFVLVTPSSQVVSSLAQQGTAMLIGKLIFSQYILAFELASVLLLIAMVGAIVLSKKRLDVFDSEASFHQSTRNDVMFQHSQDINKELPVEVCN